MDELDGSDVIDDGTGPRIERNSRGRHSIISLRLDVDSATKGKTWLLLPKEFRAKEHGALYPLPSDRKDLQRVAAIPVPAQKMDSGCIYIRRCLKEWRSRAQKTESALNDIGRREQRLNRVHENHTQRMKRLEQKARAAVESVEREAEKAAASLNTLFALGREGIEGQMKAYLANKEYNGAPVDHKGFRECFRMVTQAVKGLGMPSDERKKARETILAEAAEAIRETRGAMQPELESKLTPDDDGQTKH